MEMRARKFRAKPVSVERKTASQTVKLFWTAVAECSGDTAFARPQVSLSPEDYRPLKAAWRFALPPQSITDLARSDVNTDGSAVSLNIAFLDPRNQNRFPAASMNKRAVIKKIVARLVEELETYFRAAQFSRAEATHESSKAENKYDTRGLEASYLARGQSKQAAELKSAITEFEKLPVKKFTADEPVDLGALIELEHGGERDCYFIGPRAGGTEVLHDKREILVITPQSPLGAQLIGKHAGESLQLVIGTGRQPAKIINVE
jgi:transcription elongation GreA/GreB family factor